MWAAAVACQACRRNYALVDDRRGAVRDEAEQPGAAAGSDSMARLRVLAVTLVITLAMLASAARGQMNHCASSS
jgi:hypothetical protein